MPTAIKKDFHVKKGVEAPSLKIGTQEVTSLLDSSTISSTLQSPAVSKQIMNDGGATSKIYDSADLLPTVGNDSGDFAYVYTTNRLYLWNGSGWYNIALINTAPSISGADSSYSLTSALNSNTISALQVTLTATDPEGLPITFSAVGSDSASSFVDITQDSSVTTITPKNRTALALGDSAGGSFSITFKATDGTFIAPSVSSFTLQFPESFALFVLTEMQKFQSDDIQQSDEFGQDVALSDKANYAIVGAWKEDEKASDAGAAYIFARSGNSLVQQAKLMAGDGSSSDSFGYSVDINKTGTHAIVGAKAADPSSAGAAYIYKRTGTSWEQIGKVNNTSSPSSSDWYGVSVAISNSGDRVVVGSHSRSSGTGAAYVYKESTGTYDVTNVPGNFISASNALNSQNSTQRDIAFNANGTKMFILGSGGTPSIYQYSLSTAYNTSTWTYDSVSFAVNTQVSAPAGLHFNTDGTKMFISGQHSGTSGVWQYTLSTGFNLSTASYSNVTLNVNSQDSGMHGMTMNPDGTKMVLVGNSNNKAYGYDLSTGFDLSTASYASEDFGVGSQEATPQDVIFNSDGTKMMVTGSQSDDVHVYTLSTAYNVSTASFSQTVNYGNSYSWDNLGAMNSPTGMQFNSDGTKFYIIDSGRNRVYQFSALAGYELEQELVRSSSSTGHYYGYSVDMDDDGDTVVVGSYGNNKAYVWTRSGYGISSVSQHVASYNLRGTLNELEDQHGIAFNSDGTKAFIVGTGGNTGDLVLQYTLSTAYDLSTASYNSVKLSVASQTTYPSGIFFKPDGTKMYISSSTDQASGTHAVFQYSLSTAFDLSTASYDNVSIDLRGASEGGVHRAFSIAFKPDGTKMFIVNRPYPNNTAVFEYHLSTAWDISTFSYDSNFNTNSQDSYMAGIAFNTDGTIMYLNGSQNLYKYTLTTGYDVSTASYSNTSIDLSSQSNNSRGITFTPDGSRLFVCSAANDDIDEYGNMLWTQQQQIAGSQAVSTNEYFGRSVSISEDGLTVLVGAEREGHSGTTRPGAGYIFKYGTNNYDVINATHDHSSPAISQDTQPSACLFNGDGTKVFVFGYQNDKIYQYNLSTAYDVSSSSMSYISGSDITLSDFSGDPSGARWNNNGTKLFIIDKTNDRLHQYTLSTAYDLSTLSYDGYASVSQATTAFGFDFNNDGTKVFVCDRSGDRIYQYSMSTPYDYSTITYDNIYASTTDGNTDPFGIAFNSTGTRYFVTDDDSTPRIHIYECANPYDISDVEHIGTFNVGSQENYPKQITFSPDGSKMFLVGNDSDKIQRYDVQTANAWYQEARLQQINAGYQDWMGGKASISGDGTAAVLGANYAQGSNGTDGWGEMYVFTRSATGLWSQTALRMGSDTQYQDRFGTGVSISPDGRYVLAGAPQEDTNGSNAGKAYFFKAPQNQFTFPWSAGLQEAKIDGQTAGERMGFSVALDQTANKALIGAQYANSGGNNYTGAAYIYARSGTSWSQEARIAPSDGANGDRFGTSVALSLDGTTAAVGAYLEDPENRSNAGSVYVFNATNVGFNLTSASFTQSSPAFTTQESNPRGFLFNSDGSKLYIIGTSTYVWKIYSLSSPYDITTASYDGSSNDVSNTGVLQHPDELKWSSDGSKVYILDTSDKKIYESNCSTAYDISTASHNSFGSFGSAPLGFDFNPAFTKVAILESGNRIKEFHITSGNINSATQYTSWTGNDGTLITQPSTATSFCWNDDGKKFWVSCSTNNRIYQYSVREDAPYEIRNVSYDNVSLDISSVEGSPTMISFESAGGAAGSKLFVLGTASDKLHEFSTFGPQWSQTVKTFPPTGTSMYYGNSVDISSDGTILAVGAPRDDFETTDAGALYVMKKEVNYQVMDMTHIGFTSVNSANNDMKDIAFNSNGTKLYHIGVNTDKVVEYDLSTAYDVSTKTYNNVNFTPSAGGYNTGIRWKPDGTKIFVLSHTNNGGGTATVHRYNVSTPYDLSTVTATADQTYDGRSYLNRAWGFVFKPDGTKMFISDDNGNDINEFILSTAWDLTTASHVTQFSVSSQEYQPSGLEFNADGKSLYMAGYSNDRIHKYNLSTAYDISTMGYSSQYISVSSQSSQPIGITFHPDGSKLFMACASSKGVDTYDTSGVGYSQVSKPTRTTLNSLGQTTQNYSYMGWDVAMNSSATRIIAGSYKDSQTTTQAGAAYIFTGDGTGSFTAETKLRPPSSPSASYAYFGHSVDITEDGNTVVVGSKQDDEKATNSGSATIYNRLPLQTALFDNLVYTTGEFVTRPSGTNNPAALEFNDDGTKMFVVCESGGRVLRYSLGTAFSVASGTYDGTSQDLDISSQMTKATGIRWNTDGTKLFIVSGAENYCGVYAYDLSTAYDLTTASYNNEEFDLDSNIVLAYGLDFKPDGTRMFVANRWNSKIHQYTLTTPFDVSTAGSHVEFSTSSQESAPRGIAFNSTGTQFFITGIQNQEFNVYSVSTAYDISTASYGGTSDDYYRTNNSSNNYHSAPSGATFSRDFTKFFVACTDNDGIFEYSCSKQDWDSGFKIFNPDPDSTDYFGVSVSISGDGKTVSVGCSRDDTGNSNDDTGSVEVFHRGEEAPTNNGTGSNYVNGTGTSVAYYHVKTLKASDGANSDYLTAGEERAQALEMSKNGQYIIAGSYRADPNGLSNAGKTYIFRNV